MTSGPQSSFGVARGDDAGASAQAAEELKAGLEVGRWRTGGQVRQWLQQEHNTQIAESAVYKYLGKFAACHQAACLKS